jgi:hypothetical protein
MSARANTGEHASEAAVQPDERGLLGIASAVALVLGFNLLMLWQRADFFLQDDMLMQYMPASRDVARALRSGEWPLLTPYCWHGAGLAGEYQHAVFSPFELLLGSVVWSLPLSLANTAALLSLTHLSILAAGTYRLARAHGCNLLAAHVVTLITCSNGWMMNWGAVSWYPALTSFAWLPWTWLALERLAFAREIRASRVVIGALWLTLILTAGWLYTCAMAALLTVYFACKAFRSHERCMYVLAAAWALALALASPALAMLFDYGSATVRGEEGLSFQRGMTVALEGLLGSALPSYHTYWENFFTPSVRRSIELAGALVPLVCWGAALAARGRKLLHEQRALALLLAACTLLATSPALATMRFSFRWLPLWHLVLALIGMQAWSRERTSSRWPALAALVITTFVWLRALALDLDPSATSFRLGAWLSALCIAWVVIARFEPARARGAAMLGFVLGSLLLTYRHLPPNSEVIRWAIGERPQAPEPLERRRRYLSTWLWHDIMLPGEGPAYGAGWLMDTGGLLPSYASLLNRVEVLQGYSPVGELALTRIFQFNIHGEQLLDAPMRLLSDAGRNDGVLQLAAVDGLLVPPRYQNELATLEAHGWHRAGEVPRAVVMHRSGAPSPRVRSIAEATLVPSLHQVIERIARRDLAAPVPSLLLDESLSAERSQHFADAEVKLLEEGRQRSVAQVRVATSREPGLIVFARPWLPGWRARLGDRELDVERYDGFLPAVRVPAGSVGELELRYFPRVLGYALVLVAIATFLASAACLAELRTRRR